MHEYALVSALLEQAEHHVRLRGASSVERLHVQIGELAGVDRALFQTAFETFRDPGPFARTELAIEDVPARWECPRCDTALVAGSALVCATCRAPGRLSAGDELVLSRIEMEVPHV